MSEPMYCFISNTYMYIVQLNSQIHPWSPSISKPFHLSSFWSGSQKLHWHASWTAGTQNGRRFYLAEIFSCLVQQICGMLTVEKKRRQHLKNLSGKEFFSCRSSIYSDYTFKVKVNRIKAVNSQLTVQNTESIISLCNGFYK